MSQGRGFGFVAFAVLTDQIDMTLKTTAKTNMSHVVDFDFELDIFSLQRLTGSRWRYYVVHGGSRQANSPCPGMATSI